MCSTRLPGKVLKEFCGKPMLQFQIELLKSYKLNYKIVVATTNNKADKEIVNLCKRINVEYFVGSENDVFERFYDIVEYYKFDHIIRLTADNPLISYRILIESIRSHLNVRCDLTSTRKLIADGTIRRYVPKGLTIDIINCKSILSIDRKSLNKYEKEHVIPVFYNGKYTVNIFKPFIKYKDNLSIDTIKDFNRVYQFTNSIIKNGKLYKYLEFDT